MTDLLKAGQQWLASQLKQFAAREVVYRRDEQLIVVRAAIGKTRGEQEVGDGLVLQLEIRDYLIDTQDLVFDGVPILPERGDQIIEHEGQTKLIYEVLPIGNQKPWRYSDPFRLKYRIHTKLVSTEEV